MSRFRNSLVALVVISVAVAAPMGAAAYTPTAPVVSGPATLSPGASGTFVFTGFTPNASITITLLGYNGASASLAAVALTPPTSTSIVKSTNSVGSASVLVSLPADAQGPYTVMGAGGFGEMASTTVSVPMTPVLPPTGGGGEPANGPSATIPVGGSATIPFVGFVPGETVEFTLTGEGVTAANLAFVRAAVSSTSVQKTASAAGGAQATVILPAGATGIYALTATGSVSGGAGTVTITVGPAGLPPTGLGDGAVTAGVLGGAAIGALGLALVLGAAARRSRRSVTSA